MITISQLPKSDLVELLAYRFTMCMSREEMLDYVLRKQRKFFDDFSHQRLVQIAKRMEAEQ